MKNFFTLACIVWSSFAMVACSNSNHSSAGSVSGTSSSSSSSSTGSAAVSDLPQLHITTDTGLAIASKDDYEAGHFELKEGTETNAVGGLSIRGRGNSTWNWPKKPYRLKLDNATEMLGMSASKHWVLLANYPDKTLVRNSVAFTFSRNMGFEYTVDDRNVELYVNAQYQGIYQLVEQIRLAKNRVFIDELKKDDVDTEVISGGYLIEMDRRMKTDACKKSDGGNEPNSIYCLDGVNLDRAQTFCIDSAYDMNPMCLHDPDYLLDTEAVVQRDYITQYINDTESALFSDTFSDPNTGYAAYLDIDSVVDYYIINEFFKNVEGAETSFYMYKKRDGKLFFGPIWDFDISMGSNYFSEGQIAQGWVTRNAPWYARLFEDSAFETKVKVRWQDLENSGEFEKILTVIEQRTAWMSSRQQYNFARWPFTSIELWLPQYGTYAEEADKLISWQRERYNWLSAQFNSN